MLDVRYKGTLLTMLENWAPGLQIQLHEYTV